MMIKKIVTFFDKLEDKVRGSLSTIPIVYAAIASIGMILLWRGIWHIADSLLISGTASTIIGTIILLLTGVFVSGFIGNSILLTGLRNEKKLTEKSKNEIEEEISEEKKILKDIKSSLTHIEERIDDIEKKD